MSVSLFISATKQGNHSCGDITLPAIPGSLRWGWNQGLLLYVVERAALRYLVDQVLQHALPMLKVMTATIVRSRSSILQRAFMWNSLRRSAWLEKH